MKHLTKFIIAALMMFAISVQAAKVLTGWYATSGYNKQPGIWNDDGKVVTLKSYSDHDWILFRSSPALNASAGQKLKVTFKGVKLTGNVKAGYYAYSSGFSHIGGRDELIKAKPENGTLSVEIPVTLKNTNIVRPRLTIMAGGEISFTGISFEILGKADPKYPAKIFPFPFAVMVM